MDEEIQGFGFGRKNFRKKNEYLGRFVCVTQNGISVHGILEQIDIEEGCAYFMPSIIGRADGSLEIMQSPATKMSLPLTIIRPMPGTLEEYVTIYNEHQKELEKRKLNLTGK